MVVILYMVKLEFYDPFFSEITSVITNIYSCLLMFVSLTQAHTHTHTCAHP